MLTYKIYIEHVNPISNRYDVYIHKYNENEDYHPISFIGRFDNMETIRNSTVGILKTLKEVNKNIEVVILEIKNNLLEYSKW